MSLENIKDDILSEAEQKAESIVADARKEAAQLMKEAEKKANKLAKQKEEETKAMLDSMKKHELANVEIESKKMLLESKKSVIEKVFREAESALKEIDQKKRADYTRKLLAKAKEDIDIFFVYCNRQDASLIKGYTVKNADIIGGLIAENKDKTIMVDYSFDTMLQELKEKEMQQVYRIMFD